VAAPEAMAGLRDGPATGERVLVGERALSCRWASIVRSAIQSMRRLVVIACENDGATWLAKQLDLRGDFANGSRRLSELC